MASNRKIFSKYQIDLLNKCKTVIKPSENVKISEIIANSQNFPIEFPIQTCRVHSQPEPRHKIIEEQINSAYPVIHEQVIWLYLRFLEHKTKYGNKNEKEVYSDLGLIEFVDRLLSKRCVTFFQKYDKYLLISKETGTNSHTTVGAQNEKYPLILKNCLSYDEIKLSALLSVSSHTEFINDGNRQNIGIVEKDKSNIELSGVVIGLIGARLVKRRYMEAQDIIISKEQNIKENGYGGNIDGNSCANTSQNKSDNKSQTKKVKLANNANVNVNANDNDNDNELTKKLDYRKMWNDFYEAKDFLYQNIQIDNKRFHKLKEDEIFDSLIMEKRYILPIDTLLLEAEARAANANKKAYIHVVGIGLGVWKCWDGQENIFLSTFAKRIKKLLPNLKNISLIHFSYFNGNGFEDLKNNAIFKDPAHSNGIKIFISKRNPHQKLKKLESENYLPIVSYAWDGNALPGNEFWMKYLKSTGDSAAACSTLITELHNPHINKKRVNGDNLHIASEKFGVIHISEYVKKFLQDIKE